VANVAYQLELSMPKENAAAVPTAAVRELLPYKSVWLTVDSKGFRSKSCVLDLPDDYSVQDVSDNPKLFRTVQADRNRALNAGDKLEIWWFDKVATAIVDFASPTEVVLTKMQVLQRRPRDREPWSNGEVAVRPADGKWAGIRVRDNVRLTGLYDNWEAARAAVWQLSGVRP
jgi:hypothetical protein